MMNQAVMIKFEMPVNKIAELEKLMKEVGVQTKGEMFNYALHILAWAINERKGGNTICALQIKEGVYTELELPVLDAFPLD